MNVIKLQAEWPHITMVNQMQYADTSYALAGCAFLLETGNEIVAVTAKHILRYFRSRSMSSLRSG